MLKVKKLTAKNVHGRIPIKLVFDNKISFLCGANGCGKTTVLKLISSILQPNFELINQIDFEKVSITCNISNREITIEVTKLQDANIAEWKIKEKWKSKSKTKPPELSGALKLYPDVNKFDISNDEYKNIKENILSEFVDSEFYKTIDSYGNPILLGIDRKVSDNFYDSRVRRRLLFKRFRRNVAQLNYIDAEQVIVDYVSRVAEEKKFLIEKFKANIFKSLFKYVGGEDAKNEYAFLSEVELIEKKEVTISAVRSLDLGNEFLSEIDEYFLNIQKLQDKINIRESDLLDEKSQKLYNEWWANRPHLRRIELVSEYADEYQKQIDNLDFPLNEISKITNSFFEESGKTLKIGANGRIRLELRDKETSTRNLSSGEIQLIVILTHLVFCEFEKEHSVFLIDEPELSLHLSWQEKFVDAITLASPGTQFILATHSPAIISNLELESKCLFMGFN